MKGIAELHGGRVSAASDGDGRGAEFVVRLPALPATPRAPRRTARRTLPAPPRHGRRVLVVDDNSDAADSLAQIVELFGHTAEVAYDGPSALAKAHAHPPERGALRPRPPGPERLRRRAGPPRRDRRRRVRLVAVSGYAQPEDVERAADAGFDGHVAKPPDPLEIERLLV